MAIEYSIQGTRYAAQERGYRRMRLRVELDYLAEVARIMMYARHRRGPKLLQFDACQGIAEDDLGDTYRAFMTLNVDERMRLYFSTRDPGCDIETIRFNFEELAFPWLLEQMRHTICTSRRFFDEYRYPEEQARVYPRTKHVLTQCYRDGGAPQYFTDLPI